MQNKVVQGKLIWLKQTLTSVNKINYGFVNKKIIKKKKKRLKFIFFTMSESLPHHFLTLRFESEHS